jgi:formylglycine-generating enzyme required for sulfatase activity/serine/threonine protein kinase
VSDQSKSAEPNDPRVDAALREYLERLDRGEPVDREEFISRNAEIADALRSFFAAEEPLRKMAVTKISEETAGISTRSFAAQGQETVPPKFQPIPETTGSGLAGRFGRYEIIRALGRGAMGAVYLAQDTQLERHVAIKTPHFEDDPTGELLARFYREARAAATLRSANICPVHDVGQIDGKHFISMAYIEGRPLSDVIKSGKALNEPNIVTAIRKLAQALQEAHDHGIVHRDLKPANIMVDKKGEPIIMDFGLARRRRAEGEASLTHSGDLVGSPAYMSPEQIEGDPDNVGPLSDQYSLGVVLYEMLTGQLPFRGSVINVLAQILTKEMTRPSALRPGLDPRIEAVCLKMMSKKASDRFPSMKAVADHLAAIVKNPATAPSPADKSRTASRATTAATPAGDEARASQIRKSVKEKVLTESDVKSLEELVRKCLRRRDYDQMIQIIERIPEERRSEALQTLLEKAREKIDEITFLICEIDEADRLEDRQTALKKAEELLKIKPGHHRALAIQEKYSGEGEAGPVRIGAAWQLTERWDKGGWLPWAALAFGLAVFAVMAGVMFIYLGRTVIVVDVQDPGIEVAVKGSTVTITGPDKQSVKVEPGEQELKITYAGLETVAKSFSLKKGDKKTVAVSIVNKEIVARLENEALPLARIDTGRPKAGEGSDGDRRPKEMSAENGFLVAPFDRAIASAGQVAWAGYLKTPVEMTNSIGMHFVIIPPGEFTMGSTKDQAKKIVSWSPGAKQQVLCEQPQVRVKIPGPFFLGAHEVTRGDFAKFVAATGYKTEAELEAQGVNKPRPGAKIKGDWRNPGFRQEDSHPVVNVSGADARAFCDWLSAKEGRKYRVPREAEWEYACRAGTTTIFYTGDDPQEAAKMANMVGAADGFPLSAPVGSFPTNPFGLYDMYGNVWEMCRDWGTPTYAEYSADGNPPVSADPSLGVARGGGADCSPTLCRSAVRGVGPRTNRAPNLGFRVLREVEMEKAPNIRAKAPEIPAAVTKSPEAMPRSEPRSLVAPFDAAAARTAQKEWSQYLEAPIELPNSIGMKLSLIPPGTYVMGAPNHKSHRVRITHAFYLGTYPVTRGDFAVFSAATAFKTEAELHSGGMMINNDSKERLKFDPDKPYTWRDPNFPQDDKHPVVNVTWDDAVRFCQWLLNKEGRPYRLPSEAEWEFACRAGTTGSMYEGQTSEDLAKLGNVLDATTWKQFPAWQSPAWQGLRSSDGWVFTSPVGLFRPNNFGLYDTLGNVWQWCSDWCDWNYYDKSPEVDPQGPAAGAYRAMRGGSFLNLPAADTRAQYRGHAPDIGFRIAYTIGLPKGIPAAPASADPDRRAAETMLALGSSITVRVEGQDMAIAPGGSLPPQSFELTRVNLNKRPDITDAAIEPLEGASHLMAINFGGNPTVGDAGLAHLGARASLRDLDLWGTGVTDAGMAVVERLPHLERLSLDQTSVTDRGLAHIDKLTELQVLAICNGPRVTDAGLAHLKNLTRLRDLRLWVLPLNGSGLKYLSGMKELEYLGLTGTQITNDALVHLQGLEQLQGLHVGRTRVTAAGLSHLRPLTHLVGLGLSDTHLSNAGLTMLRPLKGLRQLDLTRTGINDGGLAELKRLTQLEELLLNGNQISDAGLIHLRSLSELTTLRLGKTPITDAGLVHLDALKKLRVLGLGNTRATDAGLATLKNMTALEELNLANTKVTPAGVATLQKSLPRCRVITHSASR